MNIVESTQSVWYSGGCYDEQRIRITFNIELISHETETVIFMRGLPVIYASYNCVYKYIHTI